MEGAPIPYDTSIWDAQRGHANYLAQALQQPLLLPRDMESIRRTRQPDLFMSLKRDLAQTQHDVEKALGTVNHEKTQLAEKLKAA